MSAPHGHDWRASRDEAPNGSRPGYACAREGCNTVYDGTQGVCLAPSALQKRLDDLAETARALSVDIRAARDAAEPGAKAAYRYPLRHVEQAVALIERAAK